VISLADVMSKKSMGLILSGNGPDGAEGLLEISRVGGLTIIQDPRTCLCKEMAKSALEKCDPDMVISDSRMASEINGLFVNGNRMASVINSLLVSSDG
jgi:two-component system chemotaxis response regulator CheB